VDEVRRLRLEKGWSQNELAYHAKLAPSVISLIETGKREPNATSLRKLAEALEVRIPDLFEESGSGKAGRRSSAQPTLLNGLEDERRVSVFAEAMIGLADHWVKAISDPELTSSKIGGLVDAALDLGDVVYDRAGDLWNELPPADQHLILDIGMRTNEVAKRGLERLQDEENAAEFKRRREKIRERTREISRWSAETA
jgi:transcriptional regulator with XRE-family HTH domain